MDNENKEKITVALANTIMNQLNLQGLLEAAKVYSLGLAEQHYEKMTDEERAETLLKIRPPGKTPSPDEPKTD